MLVKYKPSLCKVTKQEVRPINISFKKNRVLYADKGNCTVMMGDSRFLQLMLTSSGKLQILL